MEKWNKNLFLLIVRKSYMVLTGKISHWRVHRKPVTSVPLLLQICFFSLCNLTSYHRYLLLISLTRSQILRSSISFSQIRNKGYSFCYSWRLAKKREKSWFVILSELFLSNIHSRKGCQNYFISSLA